MIPRSAIETAYAFFHQKERVYAHSTMEWQKDDIEYAISQYVQDMNPQLFDVLADGRKDFLCSHPLFHEHIKEAIAKLERLLEV